MKGSRREGSYASMRKLRQEAVVVNHFHTLISDCMEISKVKEGLNAKVRRYLATKLLMYSCSESEMDARSLR